MAFTSASWVSGGVCWQAVRVTIALREHNAKSRFIGVPPPAAAGGNGDSAGAGISFGGQYMRRPSQNDKTFSNHRPAGRSGSAARPLFRQVRQPLFHAGARLGGGLEDADLWTNF